ncbi:MAG: MBL fold metallo-hydrolase [Bacillota bacterium]|nr:MBL fold metallo-hydrolase [Bacillota bacterium]
MLKRILTVFLALVILFGVSTGFAQNEKYGSLRIRYFKIGKADAFLLRTDKHAVLIDAGEEDDGPEISSFLVKKQINTLDYLILTHFDKRSIGGVPEVLEAVKVNKILIPDYKKESALAMMVFNLIDGMNVEKVTEKMTFSLDRVEFAVLPAALHEYSEDDDNNFSLVTTIKHGENSFFFSGDIMSQRITEMLDFGLLLPHTVIKMPCHGQNINSLDVLLDNVSPRIAVIPASAKNPPAGAVISDLEARGIRWYCTKDGSVSLTSDGYGISIEQTKKIKKE